MFTRKIPAEFSTGSFLFANLVPTNATKSYSKPLALMLKVIAKPQISGINQKLFKAEFENEMRNIELNYHSNPELNCV